MKDLKPRIYSRKIATYRDEEKLSLRTSRVAKAATCHEQAAMIREICRDDALLLKELAKH